MALAVALAVAASACGGDSNDDVASRYFHAVVVEQGAFEKAQADLWPVLALISERESWSRAVNAWRRGRDRYDELAVAMDSIEPPPTLRQAHEGLVESLRSYSQWADEMAAAFQQAADAYESEDAGLLAELTRSIRTLSTGDSKTLRSRWRLAARGYAREVGVDFPPDLLSVGTSGNR